MSRRTFILLLLIAATALLTFGAHTRLVNLILAPPPTLPSLRPVPPLATVTSILSVLSKATAARVSAALASPSLANVSVGALPAYAPLDFREQARLLALYAPIADALAELDAAKAPRAGELRDALAAIAVRLERHLFPWSAPLRAGLHPVLRGGRGRGIVMTTGAAHFRYALLNLRHLAALGCRLPVEVWLGAADDLPAAAVAELRALNATVRVMARHVDVAALRLAGYAFKPFALLLSAFDEALLLDADAYFVQEPSALYADPYYEAHGALFFADATHPPAPPAPTRALLAALWPDAAAVPHRVAATRFFRGESLYEQESSVVLVHRSRRALGLLGTALLNGWPARDFVYRQVLGDKETFWLGFALAGEPFDFSPHSPAILGAASSDGVVCGQMAHPDHQGKLLYWNGGFTPLKSRADVMEPIDFRVWGAPEPWLRYGLCTRPALVKPLTTEEQRVVDSALELFRAQQRERDRISGYQVRVFFALVALVVLLALCVCVALFCWGLAAVPRLKERSGDGDSDDEDERYHSAMWHRP